MHVHGQTMFCGDGLVGEANKDEMTDARSVRGRILTQIYMASKTTSWPCLSPELFLTVWITEEEEIWPPSSSDPKVLGFFKIGGSLFLKSP